MRPVLVAEEGGEVQEPLSTLQAGCMPCLAKASMTVWQNLRGKKRSRNSSQVKPVALFSPKGSPDAWGRLHPCCCWAGWTTSDSAHHTSSSFMGCDVKPVWEGAVSKQNYEEVRGGSGRRQRLMCHAGHDTVGVILKGWASSDSLPLPQDGAHPRPWAQSCVQTWGKFELGLMLWS